MATKSGLYGAQDVSAVGTVFFTGVYDLSGVQNFWIEWTITEVGTSTTGIGDLVMQPYTSESGTQTLGSVVRLADGVNFKATSTQIFTFTKGSGAAGIDEAFVTSGVGIVKPSAGVAGWTPLLTSTYVKFGIETTEVVDDDGATVSMKVAVR